MTHALGVYWSVAHRRPQDYAYFKALNPPVVKIMDGGPPDYAWVHTNLPSALVVARDWALSEQHGDVRRDPVGTGKRHAREWKAHQARLGFDPARTIVLGQNEPHVWEDFSCVPYTVAFLDECAMLGLRAGALNLSVGWPANNGPDTPPDWAPYELVQGAIKRGRHALVTHSYWADLGPSELWGWWGGRTLRCPWDVPIVIGECGFEMAVKRTPSSMWDRGWQAHIKAEVYAGQLIEYANRMAADSRILGVCPFLSDFQNREWASLDLEPAYNAILARSGELRPIAAPVTPPPVAPKPRLFHPLPKPALVTQRFGENPEIYGKFSVDGVPLKGHNGTDFGVFSGTEVKAVDDGTVIETGDDPTGWGFYVKMSHAWGESLYAHLKGVTLKVGSRLPAGGLVGLSGNSGNSTGPHLHLGIRLNPYLRADGWGGYSDPLPLLASDPGVRIPAGMVGHLIVAAYEFKVSLALLASLAWAESSFRPDAVSPAGALGLMQMMPATWAEWAPKVGATDPFSARDSARVGAAYLAWLLKQLGNEWAAVSAYLLGIGNVLAGVALEGQNLIYVSKVLHGADLLEAVAINPEYKVFMPIVRDA